MEKTYFILNSKIDAFNKSRMNYSTRLASLKYILKETER